LETIKSYAKLANTLIENLVWDEYGPSFGPYLKGFEKTPVFREYLLLLETRNPVYLRFLLSFLWFGKKLSYINPDLESTAFREWLDLESALSLREFDSWEVPDLKQLISALCGDLDSDELRPKHGSGAVAEKKARSLPYRKTALLSTDGKLRSFYRTFTSDALRYLTDNVVDQVPCDSFRHTSRLMFVPKDYKKMRTICMEPASYMFLQQSLMRVLYRNIKRATGGILDLHDQGPNVELAKYASLTSDLDTLDLSSASDSVHVDLIRKYFPRRWKLALLSTRTSRVEVPGGEVVQVYKFAPMGSAVCFPIQTIVFTAVVLATYLKRLRSLGYVVHTPSTPEELRRFLYRYVQWYGRGDRVLGALRVYGDDIICDSECTLDVISCLEELGFTVNVNKSFRGRQAFRESCGGFFWCGEDVTPVLYRIKRSRNVGLSDESLSGAVDLANKARSLGYFNLAKHTRLLVSGNYRKWRYIPYVIENTYFGYHCNKITDYGVTRYNKGWQRYEQKVVQPRWSEKQRVDRDDFIQSAFAYYSHARANHGSETEINQQSHFKWWEHTTHHRFAWVFIPCDR
jgi:hypothetical protein